jgi:hypothetical protein
MTADRLPLLLLLLGFVSAFVLTRLYTRLARARGWGSGSVGGVHLHHIVVGILLVLLSGLLTFALDPGGIPRDLLAIGFGVGAALILDEFALSFYLRDVYWAHEGHSSIDATVGGLALTGLLLVGIAPFGIGGASYGPRSVAFAIVAGSVVFTVATFLKGKVLTGIVGVFFPPLALVGAIRLAKPHSLWARRCYRGRKSARAAERYTIGRTARLHERIDDVLGGMLAAAPERSTPS